MTSNDPHELLARHYGRLGVPSRFQGLGGAGGFSGARLWLVEWSTDQFCLRCWPREHPDRERLSAIHRVLKRVAENGFDLAPLPLTTASGETFVEHAGALWQLEPWMPGEADFRSNPTSNKLTAALRALASFHRAADLDVELLPSPGLRRRYQQIQQLAPRTLPELERGGANTKELGRELEPLLHRYLRAAPRAIGPVSAGLDDLRDRPFELRDCIRDIWHAHVLYQEERVSGIIDFGAMCKESPATDVARLLGSMAADDPASWAAGLDAYQEVRPLTDWELVAVRAFDRSTVLLGPSLWFRWLLIEGRRFDDPRRILPRLRENLIRLESLIERPPDAGRMVLE